MTENWKPVVGYEEWYEVSDEGRVRSLQSGRWRNRQKILRPSKLRNDYLLVKLCKDGKAKHMLVHRLVAEAFVQNPQALPQVNHKDEDKKNNSVANLEWCSARYNSNYGTHNRRVAKANVNNPKRSKPVQQLDRSTGEVLATFPSAAEAKRNTGIAHGNISQCCLGERKTAGGYCWRYVDKKQKTKQQMKGML